MPQRRVILLLMMAFLPCGCGTRVQEPHYYKITRGMPEPDVEELLGPGVPIAPADAGVTVSPDWTLKRWRNGGITITVAFADGAVVARQSTGFSGGDNPFGWPTDSPSYAPATAESAQETGGPAR